MRVVVGWPGILAFAVLYALVHGALAVGLGTGLNRDDAEAAEMLQHRLAAAYQVRNPPLYEWLLWGVERVVGVGPLSHALLRHALVAGVFAAAYHAGRTVTRDPRGGAAFAFGLFLTVWFAQGFLTWGTHTLILTMAIFGFAATLLRLMEARTWGRHCALAGFAAAGLLAKWSFALVLLTALLALVADAPGRRVLGDRRILLVPALCALALAPPLLWIAGAGESVLAMSQANLAERGAPWAERVVEAAWRFPVALLLFLLPWLGVVAGLGWHGRCRVAGTLPRWALLSVLLAFLGAVAVGATNMGERYMYPAALVPMLAIFAAVWRDGRLARRATWLIGGGLAVAAVMLLLRIGAYTTGGFPEGKANRHLIPFGTLAAALRDRGLGGAQFLAEDSTLSGNLLTYLPGARSVALRGYRVRDPGPPPPGTPCVAIWQLGYTAGDAPPPPLRLPDAVAAILPPGTTLDRIAARWAPTLLGARRTTVWALARVDEDRCIRATGG